MLLKAAIGALPDIRSGFQAAAIQEELALGKLRALQGAVLRSEFDFMDMQPGLHAVQMD